MHPELTELTNRIAAFAEHGDPQPVLDPEAVLLARRIWTGASGDEPPVEVVHVVAQLHWCRVLALPAGQREEDIELSARLFGLLLPTHPELVPDKMRRMLARSADQWAEQAAALLGAIDNTDDPAALTRVIDLLRWSVTCSPIDHPDLPGRLSNLGVALRIRFDRDGRPAALDQAVKAGLAAVAVGAADHRDRGGHLYNAGGHLHLRFRHGAAIADLDQAVSLLEQAVHATRPDQAAHFEMVDELGRALAARCEASRPAAELGSAIRLWLDRGGGVLDWQRAVVLLRHLLSFEPATADRLTDLGHALTVGSTWTGSDTDLDEAIDLLRRAAADTPAAETDHGGRLARLASALRLRFERTGAAEHLEEAAALLRRALTALPTHHPDRDVAQAEIGVVLYQRFSRTGALPDLDEAITHLRDVAQFNVLGIALRARFERTGKPADQAESVDVLRRAVAALPAEHPERAFAEANLATTLLERWQRSGTQADIDQVIGLLQQAAAALPKPSPQHRQVMSNLGVALRLRYERTGVAADLDRAISAAMANSSPNSGQLSNLAVALIARFRRDSTSRDLDLVFRGYAAGWSWVSRASGNRSRVCWWG